MPCSLATLFATSADCFREFYINPANWFDLVIVAVSILGVYQDATGQGSIPFKMIRLVRVLKVCVCVCARARVWVWVWDVCGCARAQGAHAESGRDCEACSLYSTRADKREQTHLLLVQTAHGVRVTCR